MTDVRPIRSTANYQAAKQRVEYLIGQNASGARSDEIEILSLLLEEYQRQHVLTGNVSAIEAIRFRMAESGLSARDLEPFIGTRSRVSEVLGGKRPLSLDMIRSLHDGLGLPYASLIQRQGAGDQHQGWLFFATESPVARALHKKSLSKRASQKMDWGALVEWQRLATSKAKKLATTFNRDSLSEEQLRKFAYMSAKARGPRLAVQAARELGIGVVVVEALPGTYLDGAAMLDEHHQPLVALTLRHDRTDNFWFTFLHELSHISLHYEYLENEVSAFIDDLEIRSGDAREVEADDLCRKVLVPDAALKSVTWGDETSNNDIVAAAARARVHISVVAGRWQREFSNYRRFSRLIERGTIRRVLESRS